MHELSQPPSAGTTDTACKALPRGLAVALALTLCLGAGAQTAPAATNAQQRLQQELAACANGSSHQDPATCRREALNANAEAGKGQLTAPRGTADPLTQRCTMLPAEQRSDCLARMREGTTQGSVEGGGMLREHTTTVIVPPAAAR